MTKFLKSVTWRDPSEVKQAVEELLPQWTEIDTDDALELLGPSTVDSRVRAYAVKQLSRADDDVSRPLAIEQRKLVHVSYHLTGAPPLSTTIGTSAEV